MTLTKELEKLDTVFKNLIGKVRLQLRQMGKKRPQRGEWKALSPQAAYQFCFWDSENLQKRQRTRTKADKLTSFWQLHGSGE